MRREYPPDVSRFLRGFGNHAKKLLSKDEDGRNADIEARVAEQIFAPWEHNQEKSTETKQTTFLRDYFNCFWEVVLACDHLETIRNLIQTTVPTAPRDQQAKVITYWAEAYLNEVYIFQLRIFDFLTASERRYKKDPDFATPMQQICEGIRDKIQKALDPLIKIRGTHVHAGRLRHADPQLVRLSHLELLVNGLGISELSAERDKAASEASEWLTQQTDYFTELAWTLFDATCHALAAGIITDNGWLIVPTNYKD
jgi:hypothetical protein